KAPDLPYDLVILLLDIELNNKNTNTKKYCIPMFIASLLTMAKTWKQLKCPSTDEWINKTS
ncbi:hypothetical protein QP104_08060, partial [Alloscardovia omnicolens]|uniref:hypothetical protein n=1 Tax=Alloscardovia omnicolens TaxID=419015 RepID=UPI00255056C7